MEWVWPRREIVALVKAKLKAYAASVAQPKSGKRKRLTKAAKENAALEKEKAEYIREYMLPWW